MVKNLPSNAGDAGLIPGRGTKIPHATEQLSPRTATVELKYLNKRACVLQTAEPTRSGARMPRKPARHENPHAATREKPECHNEETTLHNERSRMPQQRSHVPQLRPEAAKK